MSSQSSLIRKGYRGNKNPVSNSMANENSMESTFLSLWDKLVLRTEQVISLLGLESPFWNEGIW